MQTAQAAATAASRGLLGSKCMKGNPKQNSKPERVSISPTYPWAFDIGVVAILVACSLKPMAPCHSLSSIGFIFPSS